MNAIKVSGIAICMVMLLASCNSKKAQSESTTEDTKQLVKVASVKIGRASCRERV